MVEKSAIEDICKDILKDKDVNSKIVSTLRLSLIFECISNNIGDLKDTDVSNYLNIDKYSVSRLRLLRNSIVHFNNNEDSYKDMYVINDNTFIEYNLYFVGLKIDKAIKTLLIDISKNNVQGDN